MSLSPVKPVEREWFYTAPPPLHRHFQAVHDVASRLPFPVAHCPERYGTGAEIPLYLSVHCACFSLHLACLLATAAERRHAAMEMYVVRIE